MTGADRPTVPPVRLPADAELARDALASPLLSRAARLARWAGEGTPVGAGGGLPAERLAEAAAVLGLGADGSGPAHAARAWETAVGTGLVDVTGDGAGAGEAFAGEALALLTRGGPADVLEVWRGGLERILSGAADRGAPGGSPEEARFLDRALGSLYLMTAGDPAVGAGAMVPLPVLAASMVVPEGMEHPTDAVLEEVSVAMVTLDERFRALEQTGMVAYRPVDTALIGEPADGAGAPGTASGEPPAAGAPGEEEVARYGMVRLTPLGLYAVRRRMLDEGVAAPLVGDLAGAGAEALLAALPGHGEEAARAEVELWLARRTPLEAARELLAAARGDDEGAPRRRLACQQALSLLGAEAEPALREVLGDGHLGGLARVWLSERGFGDVPAPSEEMVFWLTVDTLAAQLAAEGGGDGSAELRDLVRGLVDQHSGFFDKAWRVDHPATGEVLEAMSRVHPDRQAARDARKAAYRARSRG
ncbi:hypothetical protein GCM10010420_41180 [Streptomyces glaucosporus]|uniref:Uncharacterized protein n=1 Tax=Streptomyces glaucosporus TaxID=284044 RepID=A0ABP5VPJ5_9ACTN